MRSNTPQVTIRVTETNSGQSSETRAFPSAMPFSDAPTLPGKRFSAAVELDEQRGVHWVLVTIAADGRLMVVGGDRVGDRGFELDRVAEIDGELFEGRANLGYLVRGTHYVEVQVAPQSEARVRPVEAAAAPRGPRAPMSTAELMSMLEDAPEAKPKRKTAPRPAKAAGVRGLMRRLGIGSSPARIRPVITSISSVNIDAF